MIPKIIHYCWFGGKPLPPLAVRCIASWRKYLPDYAIKRWDEGNFDIQAVAYTREAYARKKYAFVSDYARFKVLYDEGGIYLDVDVELLRPLDDLLARGPYLGDEQPGRCAPGLGMACEPAMPFVKEMLEDYTRRSYLKEPPASTIVTYTSAALARHGYAGSNGIQQVAGFTIYPAEYFCPVNYFTKERTVTPNTYSIHHYAESWVSRRMKIYEMCNRLLGVENTRRLASLLKKCKRHVL